MEVDTSHAVAGGPSVRDSVRRRAFLKSAGDPGVSIDDALAQSHATRHDLGRWVRYKPFRRAVRQLISRTQLLNRLELTRGGSAAITQLVCAARDTDDLKAILAVISRCETVNKPAKTRKIAPIFSVDRPAERPAEVLAAEHRLQAEPTDNPR